MNKTKRVVKKESMDMTGGKRFSKWVECFNQVIRKGGFPGQLDGNRLHVQSRQFDMIKEFIGNEWVAWSTLLLFIKLVPRCGEHLYLEERAKAVSALGEEAASRLMGDSVLESSLDKAGRLWLPPELCRRTGIPEGSATTVIFRSYAIEVWRADALAEAYSETRSAVAKAINGKFGIVQSIPETSNKTPALPVHEARMV
jgi:hypothetical protein